MADEDLVRHLQELASNFVRIPLPKERPFDGTAFARQSGIAIGHMRVDLEQYVGFTAVAVPALQALSTGLRSADPQYRLNADKTKFQEVTTSAVLAMLDTEPSGVVVGQSHLAFVRLQIANWWSAQCQDRYFAIPCILTPYQSKPFSVGPVKFQRATDFVSTRQPQFDALRFDLAMGSYLEQMDHRAAHWIAEVRVTGRELMQAQAVADLATDVALASVQILNPPRLRNAARITGRSNPVVRVNVSFDTTDIYVGVVNLEPGRLMSPDAFDQLIQQQQQFLDSAGRRIATYINGGSGLPQLERSWCDAALWFHEGVADILNTVAVAKMETAIEVLLYAESTNGGNQRIRSVFNAFRNLGPKDSIGNGLPTVEMLAKKIVEARSRILHGTLSTLGADTDEERQIAQDLAQQLLIVYSLHLDDFLKDPGAQDDTDAFLGWVHKKLFP
ncbi:MAG: hypothetical protein ACYDBH_14005 [Acidobacteriaceae bacterium]